MSLIELIRNPQHNPLDAVERLAMLRDWNFDRATDDEVTLVVEGRWSDYQISFTWMPDIEALHIACAFDMKAPARRRGEMVELVAMVNEQLWIGHFDFWSKDGLVMFRHSLMLAGGGTATDTQCEALLAAAVDASERYFQAFQFVAWSGKKARESLDATLFETVGAA
jgi:hypothetical protein